VPQRASRVLRASHEVHGTGQEQRRDVHGVVHLSGLDELQRSRHGDPHDFYLFNQIERLPVVRSGFERDEAVGPVRVPGGLWIEIYELDPALGDVPGFFA
jgi:hypothetical protein